MYTKQTGFAHAYILIGIVGLSLLFVSALVPVSRNYNGGHSQVQAAMADTKHDVMFEIKDDNVSITASGSVNTALKQMETALMKDDVSVATDSGEVAVVNKLSGALVHFPLTVNTQTRELTVTTPAGSKVVAVLPQQAIDSMRAAHVIDDVISEQTKTGLAKVQDLVILDERNGVLGYSIHGTRNHKLLGLFPIKTNVSAFVSAENGQVVTSNESLFGRILTKLGM